jgi:hypothetical protein
MPDRQSPMEAYVAPLTLLLGVLAHTVAAWLVCGRDVADLLCECAAERDRAVCAETAHAEAMWIPTANTGV